MSCPSCRSVEGYAVPIVLIEQIKISAPVAFGEYLHIVSAFLNGFDYLSCGCCIVTGRIRVACKAEVNKFPGYLIFFKLLLRCLYYARPRLYIRVKFLAGFM